MAHPRERPLVALVTGSTDGIGRLAARRFAEQGATVCVHGRSQTKLDDTLQELRGALPEARLIGYRADLSSIAQTRRMAETILADHPKLDVLVNNAGIGPAAFAGRRELSADGFELRLAVNYLAPFVLTEALEPALVAARGRVVNLSSAAQAEVDLRDLQLAEKFSGPLAYGRSKVAIVMHTFSFAERMRAASVTANALDPGVLLATKMVREMSRAPHGDPEDGARRIMRLAVSEDLAAVSGRYFSEARSDRAHDQVYDVVARARLDELTRQLLKSCLVTP